MNNNNEPIIYYKIRAGKRYRVFRRENNGRKYYSIRISQREYGGDVIYFYRNIVFKRGIELENMTDIIIDKGYENLYKNPKDEYNPISYILVTEFTICEKEVDEKASYEAFRKNLDENNGLLNELTNEQLDSGDVVSNMFGDEDLPF